MDLQQSSKQQDVALFKAWAPYRFNKKCMLNCQIVSAMQGRSTKSKRSHGFFENSARKTPVIVHCWVITYTSSLASEISQRKCGFFGWFISKQYFPRPLCLPLKKKRGAHFGEAISLFSSVNELFCKYLLNEERKTRVACGNWYKPGLKCDWDHK